MLLIITPALSGQKALTKSPPEIRTYIPASSLDVIASPITEQSERVAGVSPLLSTLSNLTREQSFFHTMAAIAPPPSPLGKGKPNFTLPMPPPLLHTRSANDIYEQPHTPTSAGFTSPYATPQGSPSKNKLPPGATELPDVFEHAMRLGPSSPNKNGRQQLSPHSPNKGARQGFEEIFEDSVNRPEFALSPESPTRKSGKENTPPGIRQSKPATPNQAAVSRQEPYQTRDTDSGAKGRYNPQRGLTPEELEKLQLPKVKRLANVTQLCQYRQ